MGLVFDLAEAINLLAGAVLGEGAASLRDRLSDVTLRRSLVKTLCKTVNAEPGLSTASRREVTEMVSSPKFIALICGDRLPETERQALEAQFSTIFDQISQPIQAILLVHLRDAAIDVIETSLPIADRILHRTVRQINEQVADLSATLKDLISNPGTVSREIRVQLDLPGNQRVRPPLPIVQGKARQTGGDRYVSALALAIADVLGQFPVDRIVRGSVDAALILDAYRAVDRLLSHFEEQSIVILRLLDKAEFAKEYYGSTSVGFRSIVGANLHLVRITEQMRQIAKGMERLPALDSNFRQRLDVVADLCLQVVELEDFLVLRLLSRHDGEVQYEDNLTAPRFLSEVGEQTVSDFSRNLIKLLQYRSSLHAAIVNVLHDFPHDIT